MPDQHGRLTHEERLAVIYRPFFITYFSSSYPWGGTIIGSAPPWIPEATSGGRRASARMKTGMSSTWYAEGQSVLQSVTKFSAEDALDDMADDITIDQLLEEEDACEENES